MTQSVFSFFHYSIPIARYVLPVIPHLIPRGYAKRSSFGRSFWKILPEDHADQFLVALIATELAPIYHSRRENSFADEQGAHHVQDCGCC